MIVVQIVAVIAVVGLAAVAGFLVWLGTGPLGTVLLRKLWRDLRRPPPPRSYAQVELPARRETR